MKQNLCIFFFITGRAECMIWFLSKQFMYSISPVIECLCISQYIHIKWQLFFYLLFFFLSIFYLSYYLFLSPFPIFFLLSVHLLSIYLSSFYPSSSFLLPLHLFFPSMFSLLSIHLLPSFHPSSFFLPSIFFLLSINHCCKYISNIKLC